MQNDLEQLKIRNKLRLVTLQTSSIDWSPLTDRDKRIISSTHNSQPTYSLKMWQLTYYLNACSLRAQYSVTNNLYNVQIP